MRLMVHPFREYRELATELGAGSTSDARAEARATAKAWRLLLPSLLRWLFVVGTFVATTATGRFAPVETLSAMLAFFWIPLGHSVGMLVTLRILARRVPFSHAFALFLESLGPWMLVFVALEGTCLFAAQPAKVVFRALAPLMVGAAVWSVVLLYALFREALAFTRARAVVAVLVFYVVAHAFVLNYYLLAGQLWPIL